MVRRSSCADRLLRRLAALVVVVLVAASAACTTQTVRSGSGIVAGTSPLQSVERFLTAVNARDLDDMAAVFGTADGPVDWDRVERELHMDLLATVLRHDRYEIVSERTVPGRLDPTTRVGVTMTIDGEVVPDVAFLTVRTSEGRWMVQEIDVEKVTSR